MAIRTSIGTPTANSYISVASADEYFNTKDDADLWRDLTNASTGTLSATTRKENLLIQSTRELDDTYRFHDRKYYNGARGSGAESYQSLEFPRSSNIEANSTGALFIPYEVQDATCEQALWIIERQGKRTTPEGEVQEKQTISDEAYNYIKGWVNRQVKSHGKPAWFKSAF